MKRLWTMLSATVLITALVAGCGNDAGKAQPNQPNQEQPAAGGDQAANPNDPVSQFPALKLPVTLEPDAAITEYKGGKLTGKEFETFLRTLSFVNPAQRQMLEAADQETLKSYAREYTATKILSARATDAINKESRDQAVSTYDKLRTQYLSILGKDEKNFDKMLANQGLTKDQIIAEMALINSSIGVLKSEITDASLQEMYNKQDKEAFTTASVRHILITTETRTPEEALKIAKDVIARLKKGEDFAALAKELSEDPGSKDEGGLYKDAYVTDWVPEFKEAALTLPIGQISEPVKTDYGYHVMRVEDRKVKSFAEMKPELSQRALEKAYGDFVSTEVDKLITKWNVPAPKTS